MSSAGHGDTEKSRVDVFRPDEEPSQGQPQGDSAMAQVVDRNICTLLEQRQHQERRKSLQERVADKVTAFTGSMMFVYLHLALYGLWIVINLGWLPPLPRFDPSFVILAMEASVEAIFLSTFVLISQNRMAALADRRADLQLQINLLAEHEITRVIQLVRGMAEKMGVEESRNPELNELAKDVKPEQVLESIEEHQSRQTGS